MVYTGKLPLGKHNVSRIAAAADSLQMFDVAVGFKNVLTSLVNQQPPVPVLSTQTASLAVINKAQAVNPGGSASPNKGDSISHKTELQAELKKQDCLGAGEDTEEPACKRACVELSESSGQFQLLTMSKACFGVLQHGFKVLYRVTSLLGTVVQPNAIQYNNTATVCYCMNRF